LAPTDEEAVMLLYYSGETPTGGPVDLSFHSPDEWAPYTIRSDAKVNAISMGDEERGPLITMIQTPRFGHEIDPDQGFGEETVHKHSSDGLRLVIKGDFRVGREHYNPGEARLQAGAEFYGPEAYGTRVSKGNEDLFVVVAFMDKRGWPIALADPQAQAMVDKLQESNSPVFDKIRLPETLPASDGYTGLVTSQSVPVRRGFIDLSCAKTEGWQDFGDHKSMIALGGDKDVGPVIVVTSAGPGATLYPATVFQTEAAIFVTNGSCMFAEKEFVPGDVRLLPAGTPVGEVVAGRDGAGLYMILGDRSRLLSGLKNGVEDIWTAWLAAMTESLQRALPPQASADVKRGLTL